MLDMLFGLTMAIPNVITHPEIMTMAEICRERAEVAELPCATIALDDKVCFTFLDEEGESSTVHCFARRAYNL